MIYEAYKILYVSTEWGTAILTIKRVARKKDRKTIIFQNPTKRKRVDTPLPFVPKLSYKISKLIEEQHLKLMLIMEKSEYSIKCQFQCTAVYYKQEDPLL